MSWSMFCFGSHWARAHDREQINFMALASAFVESSERYRQTPWLQEWRAYWLDHMGNHGNGCSDLDADAFLTDASRVQQFDVFLQDYGDWLRTFGAEIPTLRINQFVELAGVKYQAPVGVEAQLRFSELVRAVINGDESNPDVRVVRALGSHPTAHRSAS